MKLKQPTAQFINELLKVFKDGGGVEQDDSLKKLFSTFSDDTNEVDVRIKVAALNTLYSTSINYIKPVVDKIVEETKKTNQLAAVEDYVAFVDRISVVQWTNAKGKKFKRNNLSFASKYVHFLSEYQTPIYDSYIWIVVNGYLAQKGVSKPTFTNPKNYKDFNDTINQFKKDYQLEQYSAYDLDKFLWQYGKNLITDIEKELNTQAKQIVSLEKAKSELKRRLKEG